MKLKFEMWRNAAYRYIKSNGPMTCEQLRDKIKIGKGVYDPMNAKSVAQVLIRDPRFKKEGQIMIKYFTSGPSPTDLWGIIDE